MKVPQLIARIDVTDYVSSDGKYKYELINSALVPNLVGLLRVGNNSDLPELVAQVRVGHEGIIVSKYGLRRNCSYGNGKVCCKDSCIDLNNGNTSKSLRGNEVVALSKLGSRKYSVIDCYEGVSKECNEALLDTSGNVSCLVLRNRKVCTVIIWDNVTGVAKEYRISCKGLRQLKCRGNLCVLMTDDGVWVVSFDVLYRLPAEFEPIVKCGEYEYLYDYRHGILVRCNGDILYPLVPLDALPKASCLTKSVIVAGLGDGLYVIEGNLSREVYGGPVSKVLASDGVAVFEIGRGVYRVITDGWDSDTVIKALACTTIGEGYVLCLVKTNDSRYLLEVLNPRVTYEPKVEVVRSEVSRDSYALIRVIPWFETTSLTIDSRVKVVESVTTGVVKTLLIRPKLLGYSGSIRVMVQDPLYNVSVLVPITSRRPRLLGAVTEECIYTTRGSVGREGCNLYAKVRVKVEHTVPEEGTIECRCDGLRNYSISINKLSNNEYSIELLGKAINESPTLDISLRYSEDTYKLGRYVLNLSNNVMKNPLINNLFTLETRNGKVLIRPKLSNAKLNVVCSDGSEYVVNSSESVALECAPPILVKGEYVDDRGIRWFLSSFIEAPTKLRVVKGSVDRVRLDLRLSTPLSRELIINVPVNEVVVKGIEVVEVSNGSAKVRVLLSKYESVLAAVVTSLSNGLIIKNVGSNELTFTLPLNDLIYGLTIHLLTISNGVISKHFSIKEVLKELIKYANTVASNLMSTLGMVTQ